MTVEVGKGKQGKMSVREGEDPRLVARSFCRAYSLQSEEADWLTSVLVEEMKARNLISFVPDGTGFGVSPVARRKGSPSRSPGASSDRVAWDSPMQRRVGYSPSCPSSRSIRVVQHEEECGQNRDSDALRLQDEVKCNKESSGSGFFSSSSSSFASVVRVAPAAPPSDAVRPMCFSPKSPLRVADFAEVNSQSRAVPGQRTGGNVFSHSFTAHSSSNVAPSDGKSGLELRQSGEPKSFYSDGEDRDETSSHRRTRRGDHHSPSPRRRAPVESLTEWQVDTSGTASHDPTPLCGLAEKSGGGGGGGGQHACPSKKSTSPTTSGAGERRECGNDGQSISKDAKRCVSKADHNATASTTTATQCVQRLTAGAAVRQQQPQEHQRQGNSQAANTTVAPTPLREDAACESGKGRRDMSAGRLWKKVSSPSGYSTEERRRGATPSRVNASTPQPRQHQRQQNQQHSQVWEGPLSCLYDRSSSTENSVLPNALRVTNVGSLELSQPVAPSEGSHTSFPAAAATVEGASWTEAAVATAMGLPPPSDEDDERSPLPTTLYSFVDHNSDAQSFVSVSASADEAEKGDTGGKRTTEKSSRTA